VTIILLGIYIRQENPAVNQIRSYHEEMIMGFATLVENKDGSTGGHIKRTSDYVQLLVEELRKRGYYKEQLTKDYVNDLYLAAPMHDVGKISIPDAILQKPGKLTADEFELMKQHTQKGGEIIEETFGHLGDQSYTKMAYQVAKYHHEKWNGKGYPQGLEGEEIPLCARIMAVADVFDAISEKRCYRDAMSMDKCFEIIAEGSGTDFDPLIADTFLNIRNKVELIHNCSRIGEIV
jgi:HD-GYP domain-containing protein (c-di-GMP phosphodiesterase class II)